jgi:hypothetical protein
MRTLLWKKRKGEILGEFSEILELNDKKKHTS